MLSTIWLLICYAIRVSLALLKELVVLEEFHPHYWARISHYISMEPVLMQWSRRAEESLIQVFSSLLIALCQLRSHFTSLSGASTRSWLLSTLLPPRSNEDGVKMNENPHNPELANTEWSRSFCFVTKSSDIILRPVANAVLMFHTVVLLW